MTSSRDGATASRGIDAVFPSERRPGEAVLVAPQDRRPLPSGGLRVLMLGDSVPTLMIHNLLMGDLPSVRRLEPMTDPAPALDSIVSRPDLYDLVLFVHRAQRRDAISLAQELRRRLDSAAGCASGPFVVALSHRPWSETTCRGRSAGACAAYLQLPLTHERFAALVAVLFCD